VQLGWAVSFQDSPDYPPLLKNADDAPAVLFRMGRPIEPDEKLIAIVGTRHATEAGRRFTHALSGKLVDAGLTVVSGMAEGIDSAAHRGALDAGGLTAAVWGTPLNLVYPPSNKQLAATIAERGTIYSEYLPDVQASPTNFPERNRIISGMSEAVIVIEAGHKSGALITAQYALEQGRELFAVPGAPHSPRSFGCNKLIKEGARLLTDVQDVFDELPRLGSAISAGRFKREVDLTENERRVVDLLADGPVQIDAISRETGLPVSDLMEYLLALELKGVIEELSGKRFGLVQ
jgi:DNA processing protein